MSARYGASEAGRCSCSTTSSLTCSLPTSSSSMSRRWILPFLTASVRISRTPIINTPAAAAPAASAPIGERFRRLIVTLVVTCVFVRMFIAFSLPHIVAAYAENRMPPAGPWREPFLGRPSGLQATRLHLMRLPVGIGGVLVDFWYSFLADPMYPEREKKRWA